LARNIKTIAAIILSRKTAKMGIKAGDRVKSPIITEASVVEARNQKEMSRRSGFMVNSRGQILLWAGGRKGKGIPDFKHITARISLSKRRNLLPLETLIGAFPNDIICLDIS